jgi:hypothetical protein
MALIWAPTAFAMLVTKYFVVLGPAFGRAMVAMGSAQVLHWSDLPFLQRLSFWRADLVVAFVLAPITALGISAWDRYSTWIVAGASFVMFALLAVQVASYRVVGL